MPDSQTISRNSVVFSRYFADSADANGFLASFGTAPMRSTLRTVVADMELPAGETHFGYVSGLARLDIDVASCGTDIHVPGGFYFSIPGQAFVKVGHGMNGIIVSASDHLGFLTMGWLEWMGRLRYIDGCSDSLLIPPIKKGDPCLNLLYFPPRTDQTMHTHPSDRIGMVLSGVGECLTENGAAAAPIPLIKGMMFVIHAGGRHKFRTTSSAMRVLAYHPDSDFGPTDLDHPMINRTMIDGVSASEITGIHTA